MHLLLMESDFTQIKIHCHHAKEGKKSSLWFDIKFNKNTIS